MRSQNVTAIIAAGGLGKRFGNCVKKQFLELAGQPVLYHSLYRFEECKLVSDIVLVLPEDELDSYKKKIKKEGRFNKIIHIVPGGRHRQDSVYNAFNIISEETDIVVVHDAARPLISSGLIESTINEAVNQGCAICAVRVKDTVKKSGFNNHIESTLDRESLYFAQTPQAFRYEIIKKAYENAIADNFLGTDESSLVERIGYKPSIVHGSIYNIKITEPADINLAETYLEVIKCTE